MKRLLILLCLFFVFLVACGGGNAARPTPTAPMPGLQPAADDGAAPAPTGLPEGYPARPTLPPPTPLPEGYPAAPTPGSAPTLPEGYPADGVWILHPLGLQCEASDKYENMAAAEEALEGAGVRVLYTATINLAVCAACGCPTSEHYRFMIDPDDLAKAIELEWVAE